jgi:hypothetical protein
MAAPIYRGGRPFIKPGIRFGNNTGIFNTSSAPVDGTTLANVAGPGSILMRTNGSVYVNTNTKASPTWTVFSAQQPNVTEKVLAATQTADANVTPATLTGFSWTVAAAATYEFELNLFTTQTTVGGLTLSFLLTTATLASIAYGYVQTVTTTTGSGIGSTATSGTKVIDNKTAAYTQAKVRGSFVTTLGGTFTWQFCQNTSATGADVTSILLNSNASLIRTA